MFKRRTAFPILVALLSLLLACSTLQATELKDRMAARIPAINALKDQGLIGENNAGLLEFRTGQRPEQSMVQDENADRLTVYAAIAAKQGVAPALVGQRRAQMIAEKGRNGHWYQAADGRWYQK